MQFYIDWTHANQMLFDILKCSVHVFIPSTYVAVNSVANVNDKIKDSVLIEFNILIPFQTKCAKFLYFLVCRKDTYIKW